MAIERGTVFGGRYVVQSQVGSGGMATVYRGVDQTLDRLVAIKVMLSRYAADPAFAARFKQEAQAAAALQSPYIVSVYDWGKEGDTYYIIMEYLRGTDLKTGIRSHGALAPRKVAQIGAQVCSALSVAHAHDIIHRDIKPQNIMIQPNGDAKVMDFGIARAKNSHLTQTNSVLGTAHYVSPEQAQGKELGPTSDLYSLGVVMYEAATGKLPFDGDDAVSVALKQVNEEPVPPSEINPNVDDNLEAIIMKCMAKDPAMRFQTADELRRVLNNYIVGRPMGFSPIAGVRAGQGTTTVLQGGAATTTRMKGVTEPTRRIQAGQGTRKMANVGPATSGAGGTVGMNRATNGRPGTAGRATATPARMSESSAQRQSGMSGAAIAAIVCASVIVVVLIIVLAVRGCVGNATTDRNNGGAAASSAANSASSSSGTSASDSSASEMVPVPSVVGKTVSQAQALLQQAGLELGTQTTESSASVEKGQIIRQNPSGNAQVAKGSKVNVVVSEGNTETATLPTLTKGMSADEAIKALEDAGFKPRHDSALDAYDNEAAEGTFLLINPAQSNSATLTKGTEITYGLSKGPEPATMPTVSGLYYEDAIATLDAAGLGNNPVWINDSNTAWGYVMYSDYDSSVGSEIARGTVVTLTISSGPAQVAVPSIAVGASYNDAAAALEAAGLYLNPSWESSNATQDTVLSISPAAGTMVDPGGTVTVVFSSGPATVTVPTVTGWSSASASDSVTNRGLIPSIADAGPAPSAELSGTVAYASPGEGTEVAAGSTVTLYVYSDYVAPVDPGTGSGGGTDTPSGDSGNTGGDAELGNGASPASATAAS